MTAPTIGRIVLYTLHELDVEDIVAARMAGMARGNVVHEGDIFPAMIVCVWGDEGDHQELQVFLDGTHTLWTKSFEGDKPGTWAWPIRG